MDYNAVSQLIGTLGFPIVCTIAMFYMWNKEREQHREEAKEWTQALNNNTLVMEKISERLAVRGDDN